MSKVITLGVSETHHHLEPANILSLALEADGVATSHVSVYRYQDTSGRVILHIHSSLDQSNQLSFHGVELNDGFSIVTDAHTQFAILEYEPTSNNP